MVILGGVHNCLDIYRKIRAKMENTPATPTPTRSGRSPDLNVGIEKLRNVGSRNLPRLHKLGIKTVKDLLWHLPAKYEDYTRVVPISNIEPGQKVNIQGE